jgi:hypothetical protein
VLNNLSVPSFRNSSANANQFCYGPLMWKKNKNKNGVKKQKNFVEKSIDYFVWRCFTLFSAYLEKFLSTILGCENRVEITVKRLLKEGW